MLTLVVIGFLGGVVAAISPCILPVLPVVLAAGVGAPAPAAPAARVAVPAVTGTDAPAPALLVDGPVQPDAREARRRALAVVAGLAVSFAVTTLAGTWLLDALHLPLDSLRWLGLVAIGVVGVGLLVPGVGQLVERPFARLGIGRPRSERGGFLLGASLGLVFVPCAGPVLAAISVVGAEHRFGPGAVVLTASFAAGVATPLALFAMAGYSLANRVQSVRRRAPVVRRVAGAVLVVTALAFALNLTDGLQQGVPGYTDALQTHLEGGAAATHALAGVTGASTNSRIANCAPDAATLEDCGQAPVFTGITTWLRTPGERPLTLAGLRGRVVLVDFWTYSCINCQRTLPHLEAWQRAYGRDGLTIVGVHTPEFAFEHVVSNVSTAAAQLGVDYPIAVDDADATWNAYENSYWPAEYLIDAHGVLRHVETGEGEYARSESFIRQLLRAANPKVVLPTPTEVTDTTPAGTLTPESYVGYQREQDLAGQTVVADRMAEYRPPSSVPQDEFALAGKWAVHAEEATAGADASLLLRFAANDVYLVLAGTGTVDVEVDGRPTGTVAVGGVPRLYQLVGPGPYQRALLTLSLSPGVQAYDFTFG